MDKKLWGGFLVVALITAFSIFYNLGGVPLLDPDEPVYAETPKEMLAYNEYISPRIYGEYWYDKPPMYYWLVVGAYKLFGVDGFAARFPSSILAVATVCAMFWFGTKLFGRRAGFVSALVLATSLEFIYLGKAAVTDITLNFFLTLSLFGYISRNYTLFYICAGLATLTKGPIGLLFPGLIVLIHMVVMRDFKELKRMKLLQGIFFYALFAFPWYIAMYHLHGGAFIETFLGFHNITRFTSPEHPSGLLWYYYIPVLLVGFFPWTQILLQSIYRSLTDCGAKFRELIFFNVWAAVIFLFFSVSQTKLVSYILPMYPAIAILVGWNIDRLWGQYREKKRQYGWLSGALLLCSGLAVGGYWGLNALPELYPSVLWLGTLWILMGVVTATCLWRRKIGSAFGASVVGAVLMAFILSIGLFPAIAPKFSVTSTVARFHEVYDTSSPVYVSKFLRPGFAFYSGIYGEELLFGGKSAPDVGALLQKHDRLYLVLRNMDYDRLPQNVQERLVVLDNSHDKMILVNK